MTDDLEPIREIRMNPIVPSESILVAAARSMRPREAEAPAPRDTRDHVETCPLLPRQRGQDPADPARLPRGGRLGGAHRWQPYPVLSDDAPGFGPVPGLQQAVVGYGRHGAIIDHHRHGVAVHEMNEPHLELVLRTCRDRLRQLHRAEPRLEHVPASKDFGPAASASIPHIHSRIIAMPVEPENVSKEVQNSGVYHQKHHQWIFCSLIDEALTFDAAIYDPQSDKIRRRIDVGQHTVERGQHFIAIKPFASPFEQEIHSLPLNHQANFPQTADEALEDLARVLSRAMRRRDAVTGGLQYTCFLHSLPRGDEHADCAPSRHWHIEAWPRTSIPTGLELDSGLLVNTISPEDAAARLRAVEL